MLDLKDLNIFDVASTVMKFIQAGLLAIEHEGNGVQPCGLNTVNGRVVLSTKVPVPAEKQVVESPVSAVETA
jgi:hypothetical protein